jgi:hypothetical protein
VDEFSTLLLAVWREACRHTDIATSTATIADLVTARLPIDHIGVLAIDWNRARLQQRAGGLGDGGRPAALDRSLGEAEKKLLSDWANSARVLHRTAAALSASDTLLCEFLLPSRSDANWMIGALHNDDGARRSSNRYRPRSKTIGVFMSLPHFARLPRPTSAPRSHGSDETICATRSSAPMRDCAR